MFNRALMDPNLEVMNFLNEVSIDYPDAISFSSGRPHPTQLKVEDIDPYINTYVDWCASSENKDPGQIKKYLSQYGRTKGIINEIIAKQLCNDEDIIIEPENILVTNGCQEAMAICLDGLFNKASDVLVVLDPTYIGITGAAKIKGIELVTVNSDDKGPIVASITGLKERLEKVGKTLKAIYVIPDFNNPLGNSFTLERRKSLVEFCGAHGIFILEDNPYGMYRYEGEKLPSLISLDRNGIVFYLGSYSKTIFPGVRIGFIAAGKKTYIDELTKVKSMTSVNTSQLMQAFVGGLLVQQNFSLKKYVNPSVHFYRTNRNAMLQSLEVHFSSQCDEKRFTWNKPEGGFFLTLDLPFVFGRDEVYRCAQEYGVICMPLSFFAINKCDEFEKRVRLAFSDVTVKDIESGIERLAEFVGTKMAVHGIVKTV